MKIVDLKPIEDITHRKQRLKRFLCVDDSGTRYIAISLLGCVPMKGVVYSQSHGIPKIITL